METKTLFAPPFVKHSALLNIDLEKGNLRSLHSSTILQQKMGYATEYLCKKQELIYANYEMVPFYMLLSLRYGVSVPPIEAKVSFSLQIAFHFRFHY